MKSLALLSQESFTPLQIRRWLRLGWVRIHSGEVSYSVAGAPMMCSTSASFAGPQRSDYVTLSCTDTCSIRGCRGRLPAKSQTRRPLLSKARTDNLIGSAMRRGKREKIASRPEVPIRHLETRPTSRLGSSVRFPAPAVRATKFFVAAGECNSCVRGPVFRRRASSRTIPFVAAQSRRPGVGTPYWPRYACIRYEVVPIPTAYHTVPPFTTAQRRVRG